MTSPETMMFVQVGEIAEKTNAHCEHLPLHISCSEQVLCAFQAEEALFRCLACCFQCQSLKQPLISSCSSRLPSAHNGSAYEPRHFLRPGIFCKRLLARASYCKHTQLTALIGCCQQCTAGTLPAQMLVSSGDCWHFLMISTFAEADGSACESCID